MHFVLWKIAFYYLNSCEKLPANYQHVTHCLTSNPITDECPHATHIILRIWTLTKSK